METSKQSIDGKMFQFRTPINAYAHYSQFLRYKKGAMDKMRSGSDLATRMGIQQVIAKHKMDYMKKCYFEDNEVEILYDIPPDAALLAEYVEKNPVDKSSSCRREFAEHEVLTARVFYENRGMNHTEGGWPKDINPADVEQTVRFKKKIEKDEMYINSVNQLSHTIQHYILQNNAVNIYETYFDDEEAVPVAEQYRTLNLFRDPCQCKRPVQQISWSPDGGTHLAAAYCNLTFQQALNYDTSSYVWDVENPNKPEVTLKPDVPIVCLEYNPKDPHSLISGLYSGQLAFWDVRKGSEPVDVSNPEHSHKDPVYNAIWINSKSGTEFFSSSPDGQVKWWDVRKLCEPLETLIVDCTKGETPKLIRAPGISVLEYESSIPTKFMVGTETGCVISGNRKGKTPAEKLTAQYKAHHGPVYALQRNPAFVKIFLTVGDWCAKIWSEDCKESAVMWTSYDKKRLTSGAWNPCRYSVFYTTGVDGTLEVWDVLHQQKHANMKIKVCDEPLTSIRCHENGELLTTASSEGSIYLLELSGSLVTPAKNEKALLTAMFDRECRREKIIESKMKEMRLKTRVGKVIDTQNATKEMKQPVNSEQINIQQAEKEFFSIIENEMKMRHETRDLNNS